MEAEHAQRVRLLLVLTSDMLSGTLSNPHAFEGEPASGTALGRASEQC
jgi:hypothetical protein